MIEDKSFNAFLKAKLEEDVVVPAVKSVGGDPRAPRRSVIPKQEPLYRPYLLAASLAIICGVFSWQFVASKDASSERTTLHAMEFLGDTIASDSAFTDRLLAWQDAPFNEIEN